MSLAALDVRGRQAADGIQASVAALTTVSFVDVREQRAIPRLGSFERLLQARDRRSRNKRIVAAVVAVVVAVAAIGSAIAVFRKAQQRRPAITPETVERLKLTGTASSGGSPSMLEPDSVGVQGRGRIVFRPVVADGHVFIGTTEGVTAFPAGCGTASFPCTPDWTGQTASPVLFSPVVSDGAVYVGTEDGRIYSFSTSCASGGAACRPAWIGQTGGRPWGAPVVVNDMVYLHTIPGDVVAFPTSCGADGAVCSPAWVARTQDPATRLSTSRLPLHNGFQSQPRPPVVAGGVVYVINTELPGTPDHFRAIYRAGGPQDAVVAYDARTGTELWTFRRRPHICCNVYHTYAAVSHGAVYVRLMDILYAFPTSCANSGPTCSPLWRAHTPGSFISSPVIADGKVFVGTSNRHLGGRGIYAFPTQCRTDGSLCDPVWRATTNEVVMLNPVVQSGLLFAPSAFGARLTVLDPSCVPHGIVCEPLWTSSRIRGIEFPVVSHGVVYVGSYLGRLYAFDASCGSGRNPCDPLWTWSTHGSLSSPTVFDGVLYVASRTGKLYTFSIPGT